MARARGRPTEPYGEEVPPPRPWGRPGAGLGLVLLLTAAPLLFFLDKPYHLDDPMFVRAARSARADPFHPYTGTVNWSGTPLPFWIAHLHPPVEAYLLAGVFALAGEGEVPAHLAHLALALGCAALAYALGRRLCASPATSALAVVLCPAFLVSATSVMADIPLLLFWLLSVWCGLRAAGEDGRWLWAAGAAASAAALSKYFGLALVPLLAAYWVLRARRWSVHLLGLALPLAALGLWSWLSRREAGLVHPLAAFGFGAGSPRSPGAAAAACLAFLGGSLAWPAALGAACLAAGAPRGGRSRDDPRERRLRGLGGGRTAALAGLAALLWPFLPPEAAASLRLQWLLWAWAGAFALAAAAAGTAARPDPEGLLLALWLGGTVLFAGFVNWTVNSRALLPAAFPAAVLALRWLEAGAPAGAGTSPASAGPKALAWSLAPAAVLSVLLALADRGHAAAVRDFARDAARPLVEAGVRVRFVGHWGFQHYMEEAGAEAFDYRRPNLAPGDRVCVSINNTGTFPLPEGLRRGLSEERVVAAPNPFGARLTDVRGGAAGFYSSLFGPVPFSFGRRLLHDILLIQAYEPKSD